LTDGGLLLIDPDLRLANCGIAVAGIKKQFYSTPMKKISAVKIDPEIMSGTSCFAGTRVPARTLIDYLEGGDSLDDFLEGSPTVTREQAIAFLEKVSERMLVPA
jgi:uncharacterized protein (DUF433 family)